MRILTIIILALPMICSAEDISNTYWSTYACDGYIYHFDTKRDVYKIYTRLDMRDKKNGEYLSYQLTEGNIQSAGGNTYTLSGKDLTGENTVDFTNPEMATFNTSQYGQTILIQCDKEKAIELIQEAEKHFKVCPKNVLNCKSS